jgi:hypothetical protein
VGAIRRQQSLGHKSSSCALLAFDEMPIHVFCDGDARVSENLRDHVEIRALASINDAPEWRSSCRCQWPRQPAGRPGRTSATRCPGPAAKARGKRHPPGNPNSLVDPKCVHANAAAISTGSAANTRYRVTERIRVAHVAPSQAPTRLPASKLTTTGQCGDTCDQGTNTSCAGNADNTTIRLMALFMITAAKAAMPNTPISNGRRNSAPPRPIRPPSTPTAAPAKNAHGIDRSRPTGTRRQHRSKYAHWLASSHDPDSRSSVVMDRAPSGLSAHPASAPPRTATNTAKASDNGTSLGTSADKA